MTGVADGGPADNCAAVAAADRTGTPRRSTSSDHCSTAASSTAPSGGPLTVLLPGAPPTLSPTAAAILLRILHEAAGQHREGCRPMHPDSHPGSDLADDAY
jgi:hypothetical protein